MGNKYWSQRLSPNLSELSSCWLLAVNLTCTKSEVDSRSLNTDIFIWDCFFWTIFISQEIAHSCVERRRLQVLTNFGWSRRSPVNSSFQFFLVTRLDRKFERREKWCSFFRLLLLCTVLTFLCSIVGCIFVCGQKNCCNHFIASYVRKVVFLWIPNNKGSSFTVQKLSWADPSHPASAHFGAKGGTEWQKVTPTCAVLATDSGTGFNPWSSLA